MTVSQPAFRTAGLACVSKYKRPKWKLQATQLSRGGWIRANRTSSLSSHIFLGNSPSTEKVTNLSRVWNDPYPKIPHNPSNRIILCAHFSVLGYWAYPTEERTKSEGLVFARRPMSVLSIQRFKERCTMLNLELLRPRSVGANLLFVTGINPDNSHIPAAQLSDKTPYSPQRTKLVFTTDIPRRGDKEITSLLHVLSWLIHRPKIYVSYRLPLPSNTESADVMHNQPLSETRVWKCGLRFQWLQ